jgi:hypothetical protein
MDKQNATLPSVLASTKFLLFSNLEHMRKAASFVTAQQ